MYICCDQERNIITDPIQNSESAKHYSYNINNKSDMVRIIDITSIAYM